MLMLLEKNIYYPNLKSLNEIKTSCIHDLCKPMAIVGCARDALKYVKGSESCLPNTIAVSNYIGAHLALIDPLL